MFIKSLILLNQKETVFGSVPTRREMVVFQVVVFPSNRRSSYV